MKRNHGFKRKLPAEWDPAIPVLKDPAVPVLKDPAVPALKNPAEPVLKDPAVPVLKVRDRSFAQYRDGGGCSGGGDFIGGCSGGGGGRMKRSWGGAETETSKRCRPNPEFSF